MSGSFQKSRVGVAGALSLLFSLVAGSLAIAQTSQSQPSGLSSAELIELARKIEPEVERLRGWKFKHKVKMDVYEEPALRAYIEKKVFEEQYGDGKLERTQAFLRLVGLIPPDCDLRKTTLDVLLSQIGGFYDPPTKSFYMLKRAGVDYGPLLNQVLIAHELTHALDDQYHDLDKLLSQRELSEDQSMALASVVEGSATLLMIHYMRAAMEKLAGEDELALQRDLQRVMQSEIERSRPFLEAPRYFSSLVAAYMCGAWFVTRNNPEEWGDAAAGPRVGERVLSALRDPPQSTEQILHPEKYWDKAQRDEPILFDDDALSRLLEPPGRHTIERNTVGELYCAILTAPPGEPFNLMAASMPTYWTNDAATGWGGDRFFLLSDGATAAEARKDLKRPRGVWITAWDTPDDRDEFFDDYVQREMAGRVAKKLGARAAVFYFGFDAADAAALHDRLSDAPLRMRKGGRPIEN